MSKATVIDLDALAPEPKRVKLAGKEYLLPGDVPVADMLAFEALAQRAEEEQIDDTEAGRMLYDAVLAIFRVHHPDLERLPMGMDQLVGFVPAVYGEGEETEEDAEGKRPAEGGTTTGSGKGKPTKPKTRARRRSSPSSASSPSTTG